MILDPQELRRRDMYFLMIGAIVPRPIAWVTTVSAAGSSNLAPFSYFNGVCSKPPLLSLCIGHRRWEGQLVKKDTLRNIEETGEFVVHVASEEFADLINASSAEFPPETSEIEELGLACVPSEVVAPPRLRDVPLAFECRRERVLMVGEPPLTGLVLGQVVRFHVNERVWDEKTGRVDVRQLRPLARLGGEDWARLGEVERRPRPDWRKG